MGDAGDSVSALQEGDAEGQVLFPEGRGKQGWGLGSVDTVDDGGEVY